MQLSTQNTMCRKPVVSVKGPVSGETCEIRGGTYATNGTAHATPTLLSPLERCCPPSSVTCSSKSKSVEKPCCSAWRSGREHSSASTPTSRASTDVTSRPVVRCTKMHAGKSCCRVRACRGHGVLLEA